MGFYLNMICPSNYLAGASPLPLDMAYLFMVGSNILLSKVVQQQAVILEFLQEKMSTRPSTLPSCHSWCIFRKFYFVSKHACILSCFNCVDSVRPHGLKPTKLLCPWNSPGKNTGVVSHFLFQGIFQTPGLNPGFLHCRYIPYHLNNLEWGIQRGRGFLHHTPIRLSEKG